MKAHDAAMVGAHVSKAGFRAFVGLIAAKLTQHENTSSCTGTDGAHR